MTCSLDHQEDEVSEGRLPYARKRTTWAGITEGERRKHQNDGPSSRIPHLRPRPGRRRSDRSFATFHVLLSIILLLSTLCAPTLGAPATASDEPGVGEAILFDRSAAPEPKLYRRQLDVHPTSSSSSAQSHSTTKAATKPTSIAASSADSASSTDSTSATGTSVDAAATPTNSPLPKPFDGGLGTNYTQSSCPNFLTSMVNNETFTSCLPFSVLLQTSMSFFAATRDIPTTSSTLDASCNIVFPACSSLISSFALALRGPTACAQDYANENPIVRQAYNGLIAYDPLYHASCLKDTPGPQNNNTATYCFAEAVTNTSSPTDSYVYYLPLGLSLPAGSMPTCSQCLKNTMAIFATAAQNKSQPMSLTYTSAATMIDLNCGPNFVNQTVPAGGGQGSASGGSTMRGRQQLASTWLLGAAVAVAVVLITAP